MVGFGLFLAWGFVLWQSARFLRSFNDPMLKMIGLAGSFVIIGFIVEGFSLDTFALPYYWFSFGLLTAACEAARRRCAAQTKDRQASAASGILLGGRNER